MIIGGLQKFSLLDYPGRVSAIIFTQGCNFRCHFCYNPMLVWPDVVGRVKYSAAPDNGEAGQIGHSLIAEDDLFAFLAKRRGKLDGVVITGGEPTLHKDLPEFIGKIKDLGYLVKLDTNGTNPELLKKLIADKLIDYIAMDLKAPLEKYNIVVGAAVNLKKIKESVKIIMESGLDYEFRTTLVPGLHAKDDLQKMGAIIKGASKWYLQNFKSDINLVNKEYENARAYTEAELAEMKKIGERFVGVCEVR